jgi:TRAP-type C4-dicarboxylate transport system permease small subunit
MSFAKVQFSTTNSVNTLIKGLAWITYFVIVLMLGIVIVNIIGRFFFHKPLLGTVELVELMMAIIGFFAIPYATMNRANVRVEILTSRLSRHSRTVLSRIASLLSAVIVGFITYQAFVSSFYYIDHLSQATTVLSIPFAPFRLIMAFGCLILFLRLLLDMFNHLPRKK